MNNTANFKASQALPGMTIDHIPDSDNVIQFPSKNPEPDSVVAHDFLNNYLAASGIHLVAITPDTTTNKITGKHFGNDAAAATAWAIEQNEARRNIHFTANMVKPGTDTKPTKADISGIRVAHVDIDPPRDNPNWDKSAALADIMLRGNPSVVIDSGNGLQALWWLSEQTDMETIEAINRGISETFRGDHCWSGEHLLRLPGFTNWPDKKKQSLGRVPVQSSIAVPFTGVTFAPSALAASFPDTKGATLVEALPDGPVAEYTGPADDDELIRKMLASAGAGLSAFGGKATVADLWNGDAETLAQFYPSEGGDDFDHSRAEASLCNFLAFWTGRDAARIDRLFRRSGLMRDKWNRESYRNITIGKAVSGCTNVYSVSAKPTQAVADLPGVAPLEGEILPNTEFLTVIEQKKYFAGCVYVASDHTVLVPSGEMLKPERFRAVYGGYMFEIGTECAPEKNAFIALTENRLHRFPKVAAVTFNPALPFGHIEKGAVNIYVPHDRGTAEGGTIGTAQAFLEHLVPDADERKRVLQWIAAKVRDPSARLYGIIMQASLAQGTGRGLFFSLLQKLIGQKYCQSIGYGQMTGRDGQGQFEDWRFRSLLVTVEEARNISRTMSGKMSEYEALKDRVDPSNRGWQTIPRKGLSAVNSRVFYSTIIATNHEDAIWLDPGDRRFDVISNGERMPEAVRDEFADWLDAPANIAAFAEHLATMDLSDFDPFRAPPMSTAKAAMIEGARSELSVLVEDAVGEMAGEIFTATQIVQMVRHLATMRQEPIFKGWEPAARRIMSSEMGNCWVRRKKNGATGGDTRIKYPAGGGKEVVYAKTSELAEKWRPAEVEALRIELGKNAPPIVAGLT